MNQYGIQRLRHLQQTLTQQELADFPDLQQHCELVGSQAEDMMARLIPELAGQGVPGEGYLARMQREVTATRQARELVTRELIQTPIIADPKQ